MRECVHIFVNMAFPDVVPHPGSERAQTALTSVNERVRYKLSHHVVTFRQLLHWPCGQSATLWDASVPRCLDWQQRRRR